MTGFVDLGVVYAKNSVPLIRVSGDAPLGRGQYAFDDATGVYRFNSSEGARVVEARLMRDSAIAVKVRQRISALRYQRLTPTGWRPR
jgi:hypothetical protein